MLERRTRKVGNILVNAFKNIRLLYIINQVLPKPRLHYNVLGTHG